MNRNGRILNPFLVFGIVMFFLCILYLFDWSSIYPKVTASVFFFIIILIFSMIVSSALFRNIKFNLDLENVNFEKRYNFFIVLIILGCIADVKYSGGSLISGNLKYGENYGIPFFHPLIVTLSSYFCMILFSISLNRRNSKKSQRIIAFIYLIIIFTTFFVSLSRITIVLTIINCVWMYIFSSRKKFSIKKTLLIFLSSLIISYLFGLVGNYRSNIQIGESNRNAFDSTFIYDFGYASENFFKTKIPGPFFWSYIYTTSSLANFQSIVNTDNSEVEISKLPTFLFSQFLPDIISKKTENEYYQNRESEITQYQVSPDLTVGTTFFSAYFILGWLGAYLMLGFMILFPFVYVYLLKKYASNYIIFGFSVLNTVYVLSFFDNMFAYSALSLQLILPFIQNFFSKVRT